MHAVICVPGVHPGDLIDLGFLAKTAYYHPDMPEYLLAYDPNIFTAVQNGLISPYAVTDPEACIYFKDSDGYETTYDAYTLLVGNHPNTQHYVTFEGHNTDITNPSERGKDLIVKVGLYITIQETRTFGGPTNTPPAAVFKTKIFSIDKQTTGVDENGNPVYVIDASVVTTLQEAKQLGLKQLGQQITFNDKDGIIRVEVNVVQSASKNVVMPLLGYQDHYSKFMTAPETRDWSEDRTINIPFINKSIKLYTVHEHEVIKQPEVIPNLQYLFSPKQWPGVTAGPDVDEDQLSKIKISHLAPVRITAYDGAGAKTIVNLTFKDK